MWGAPTNVMFCGETTLRVLRPASVGDVKWGVGLRGDRHVILLMGKGQRPIPLTRPTNTLSVPRVCSRVCCGWVALAGWLEGVFTIAAVAFIPYDCRVWFLVQPGDERTGRVSTSLEYRET